MFGATFKAEEAVRTSVYASIARTQQSPAPPHREPHLEREARSLRRRDRKCDSAQIDRNDLTRPHTCGVIVREQEVGARRNVLENVAGAVGNVQFGREGQTPFLELVARCLHG